MAQKRSVAVWVFVVILAIGLGLGYILYNATANLGASAVKRMRLVRQLASGVRQAESMQSSRV